MAESLLSTLKTLLRLFLNFASVSELWISLVAVYETIWGYCWEKFQRIKMMSMNLSQHFLLLSTWKYATIFSTVQKPNIKSVTWLDNKMTFFTFAQQCCINRIHFWAWNSAGNWIEFCMFVSTVTLKHNKRMALTCALNNAIIHKLILPDWQKSRAQPNWIPIRATTNLLIAQGFFKMNWTRILANIGQTSRLFM